MYVQMKLYNNVTYRRKVVIEYKKWNDLFDINGADIGV